MTRVLDLADPARGEEAGEFQGHLLGAGVSVIVVDARSLLSSSGLPLI